MRSTELPIIDMHTRVTKINVLLHSVNKKLDKFEITLNFEMEARF